METDAALLDQVDAAIGTLVKFGRTWTFCIVPNGTFVAVAAPRSRQAGLRRGCFEYIDISSGPGWHLRTLSRRKTAACRAP